jgi:hypothetical protein
MILGHLGAFWVSRKKWLKYPSRRYFLKIFSQRMKE